MKKKEFFSWFYNSDGLSLSEVHRIFFILALHKKLGRFRWNIPHSSKINSSEISDEFMSNYVLRFRNIEK